MLQRATEAELVLIKEEFAHEDTWKNDSEDKLSEFKHKHAQRLLNTKTLFLNCPFRDSAGSDPAAHGCIWFLDSVKCPLSLVET